MPHLHMPLQSGNNEVLGLMRRRYRRELYADKVRLIKSLMPHACIGVDVIVGFPGESDQAFEDTRAFLASLDISYLHVFTYSERDHTPAIQLPAKVPVEIRRERNAVLRALSDEKIQHFYQQHEGDVRPVLFEQAEKDGFMEGYSDNYIKVSIPYQADYVNRIIHYRLHL